MDDTTDTLARPGFPPPPPVAVAPATGREGWPGQISQAGPTLPNVAPQVPRPATADTSPFTTTMFEPSAPARGKPPKGRSGFKRAMSWVFLLAVLGGLAYAGITYGPELIEEVTGADEDNGPAAPLVYPMPIAPAIPVRSATFTVDEPDPFGGIQNYEVTADFESGVTHVVIPRADSPNLEILTLWDQSFIRRIDEPTWYTLPRGDFPIDFSLGRSRWVRTLDELLPPAIRPYTTINEATESSVGTEPARRLVVSTNSARLLQMQTAATTPGADGSTPPAQQLPPGVVVQPGPDGVDDPTIEIWVDDRGIVRKSIMPPQFGGETITVTSVTADPFEPAFPTPDVVEPLTAQVLFRLGI